MSRFSSRYRALGAVAGALALGFLISAPASASSLDVDVDISNGAHVIDDDSQDLVFETVGAGFVASATVTVDFEKIDGGFCAEPGPNTPFNDEIVLILTSPEGTEVELVTQGLFDDAPSAGRVQMTFSEGGAALGSLPATGTFTPEYGSMQDLVGEDASGDWVLTVEDTEAMDALCVYAATLDLDVTASPIAPGDPVPPTADEVTVALQSIEADDVFAIVDDESVDLPIEVSTAGVLNSAGITVDFSKIDDYNCPDPATGNPFNSEIVLTLTSAEGTSVELVTEGLFDNSPGVGRVQMTFAEGGAALGALPATGTFQPVGSLSDVVGENPQGTWFLTVEDTTDGDVLCFYGATLHLDFTTVPSLAGDALPGGTTGAAYAVTPALAVDSDPATGFALGTGALPDGLVLDPATGAISGTPTGAGTFAFTIVASNAAGDAEPVAYEITVVAPVAPVVEEELPTLPETGPADLSIAFSSIALLALGATALIIRRRAA